MKFLIIDSHKGSIIPPKNLHFQNAEIIAEALRQEGHEVDLIWSYPTVNDNVKSGYDVIIFVHASHYSFVDYEWIKQNPKAKLFYITNEYNLGENRILWMAIKRDGRSYSVIANHSPKISKIVTKYTDSWHKLNLNALIFNPVDVELLGKRGCIYYGSYRKGREKYFQKYFDGLTVSTHSKNRDKFNALEVYPNFINRIDWKKEGLAPYSFSLYIEDEITHENYNFLANRFYEALNYAVVPLFDESCRNTVNRSGYYVPDEYFVNGMQDLKDRVHNLPDGWFIRLVSWAKIAAEEKAEVLEQIKDIVCN